MKLALAAFLVLALAPAARAEMLMTTLTSRHGHGISGGLEDAYVSIVAGEGGTPVNTIGEWQVPISSETIGRTHVGSPATLGRLTMVQPHFDERKPCRHVDHFTL